MHLQNHKAAVVSTLQKQDIPKRSIGRPALIPDKGQDKVISLPMFYAMGSMQWRLHIMTPGLSPPKPPFYY